MTCCVFAYVFILLSSAFLLCLSSGACLCCPRLVLLPALFVLVSLWVFVVSFSLADNTQKERAQRFCPLRPLFVPLLVVLV